MSTSPRSDVFTNIFKETLTLEDARAFARIGAWYLILGVPASANAAQITKARRKLQMKHHQDKCGGETPLRCAHEMSALINRAADEMLASNPDVIRQRAETNARQEREELERRARERKIEEEEMITRYAKERELAREGYRNEALQKASVRGASVRSRLCLSRSTNLAFPRLSIRLMVLRDKRHGQKARCLVYAAEADIAARRAVREERFPKTANLASREPYKAALLAALKKQYDVAYQRIRYLERRKSRVGLAVPRLTRARLLRAAWEILLAPPAPLRGEEAIPLRGAPKAPPASLSNGATTGASSTGAANSNGDQELVTREFMASAGICVAHGVGGSLCVQRV